MKSIRPSLLRILVFAGIAISGFDGLASAEEAARSSNPDIHTRNLAQRGQELLFTLEHVPPDKATPTYVIELTRIVLAFEEWAKPAPEAIQLLKDIEQSGAAKKTYPPNFLVSPEAYRQSLATFAEEKDNEDDFYGTSTGGVPLAFIASDALGKINARAKASNGVALAGKTASDFSSAVNEAMYAVVLKWPSIDVTAKPTVLIVADKAQMQKLRTAIQHLPGHGKSWITPSPVNSLTNLILCSPDGSAHILSVYRDHVMSPVDGSAIPVKEFGEIHQWLNELTSTPPMQETPKDSRSTPIREENIDYLLNKQLPDGVKSGNR